MNTNSRIITLLWVLLFAILPACQTAKLKHPDGFAQYIGSINSVKSITPERVLYRVRTHENMENADLSFWKIALKTQMQDSGYIVLSDSDISTKSSVGYLLRLAAPLGTKDYSYLIALFVHGDKLVIFESAGETNQFEKYVKNIISTIENTEIAAAARL